MLMVMYDNDPRGYIPAHYFARGLLAFASRVGASPDQCRQLLDELDQHHVFSKADDGSYFSRRIIREEEIRAVRAESGRLGGLAKSKQTSSKSPSKKLAPSDSDSNIEYEDVCVVEDKGGVGGKQATDSLAAAIRSTWAIQDHDRLEALVEKFRLVGANGSEIAQRRSRLLDLWGLKADTPESLAKHWGKFSQETLTAIPGQPSKADKARQEGEWKKWEREKAERSSNWRKD
jgi:hypothetical protein